MACLDTTFFIDLARKQGGRKSRARALLRELVANEDRLCTTRFTVAELYVGVYRSRDRAKERASIEAALHGIEILEFEPTAAETFGHLTARLQKTGRPAGDMDVLIAATALSEGETSIVTRNAGHYAQIPGIDVLTY
jgi:tRNA(fMet)-specific endonuclease VapC